MTPQELLDSGRLRDAGLDALTHPDDAPTQAAAAMAAVRLGEPRPARAAAERALAGDPEDPWVALAYGEALLASGEPYGARQWADERRARGDVDPSQVVGAYLAALHAEACRGAGDAEAGVGIAAAALAVAKETLGPRALAVAALEGALAICAHALGKGAMARRHVGRALAIRRGHDPRHPDLAACLDLSGSILRADGDPRGAESDHRAALALWSDQRGRAAGPGGSCHHPLAQAVPRPGRFADAREHAEQAVRIAERHLGRDHIDTSISRFELGRFELDCGMVEEGLSRMGAARRTVAGRLGVDHPVVRAMDRWL